jgi:hypothetical protein
VVVLGLFRVLGHVDVDSGVDVVGWDSRGIWCVVGVWISVVVMLSAVLRNESRLRLSDDTRAVVAL